jgi:hypothetical protein
MRRTGGIALAHWMPLRGVTPSADVSMGRLYLRAARQQGVPGSRPFLPVDGAVVAIVFEGQVATLHAQELKDLDPWATGGAAGPLGRPDHLVVRRPVGGPARSHHRDVGGDTKPVQVAIGKITARGGVN